jgi:hypothetical protein
MQGLYQHHLYLFAKALKHEVFMDKQDFKDNIKALDHKYNQDPDIERGEIKEIDTQYIRGMHGIKQVRTLLVIGIDLLKHHKQRRGFLPYEFKYFCGNKKNKEEEFVCHVK